MSKINQSNSLCRHLLIAVRAENVRETENFANIEVNKISKWAEDNKSTFNEQESKVMVVTRRKRKESTHVSIYLNNKLLEQVNKYQIFGNHYRQ